MTGPHLAALWHTTRRILPVIPILLILRSGQILNIGFEKVFLMQKPLNIVPPRCGH